MNNRPTGKFPSKLIVLFATLGLVACTDQSSDSQDETVNIQITRNNGESSDFTYGQMPDVRACIEENSAEPVSQDAARIACAWAYSTPYEGMPPGINGYLQYEWPEITLTIENKNPIIILTEACVLVQFDVRRRLESICIATSVAPMGSEVATINLANNLAEIGIGEAYEIELDTFQWGLSSVRFLQVLQPIPQPDQ